MTSALCRAIVMHYFVIYSYARVTGVRVTRPRRARYERVKRSFRRWLTPRSRPPWTYKLNDAKKKRWVICSKIRRSKSCNIKRVVDARFYSLVIFIVTAANDASSLSFPIRESTRDRAEKTQGGKTNTSLHAQRFTMTMMRRDKGEKSTTGPSRVARTIKKRASAQILAGSKLPEKRNKRWIRVPPLSHPLLPTRPLPPCVSLPPTGSAMDRSSCACFSRVKTLTASGRGSEIKN